MKRALYILLFFIVGILLFSCAESEKVQKDEEEKIPPKKTFEPTIMLEVQKLTGWIDMMPNSDGKFNITGEIIIPPSDEYDYEEVELDAVKIIQKDKVVYSLSPTTRIKEMDEQFPGKGMIFSTIKGVSLNPNFNSDKTFDVEFVLKQGDEEFYYRSYNNKVEKAY